MHLSFLEAEEGFAMALSADYRNGAGYADRRRTVPGQGKGGSRMTQTATDPQAWARILDMWNSVDIPDGFLLVQVTEEGAVMTPPPGPRHTRTTGWLSKILERAVGDDYFVLQTSGIGVTAKGGAFVPDFLVVRTDAAAGVVHPEDAILVVEVTSPSNFDNDRETKYHAYAKGGIPQYLLIDPVDQDNRRVTLFTEPSGDEYLKAVQVSYGELITVPYPVPIVIDTSRFPLTDEG
ncbi:Uma2 family endonuclease [Kineosporia sp. NBRC 101731]|uniref:Uma2 family endonuclease n=1 Tax=Kineosporia sp. NBRC 101731 TaxID=3032199 RepID=UPI0024A503D9|nr:Uma2 family endonuclease [Kineosporia sp. NBRC 101731]GLY30595.1 hypothetical protein Kisp02_39600 [Kineosporia sp. NBRC 101731]